MSYKEISLTSKELGYLLFRKKSCPECGQKMEKRKTFEIRKGSDFNTRTNAFFPSEADVKSYKYQYVCVECNKVFTLQQLINKE